MADITLKPKPPWTECQTCINRGNCDWCPFVLGRKATPLGADHVWLLDRIVDKDGDLLRPGLLDGFTAPPGTICPDGVTFDEARAVRKELMIEALIENTLSEQQAIEAATRMGIALDAEER